MEKILQSILKKDSDVILERIKREEDDSEYDVWIVITNNNKYILKKCKGNESYIYNLYFKTLEHGVPKLYNIINYHKEEYILLNYFAGENLCKANKNKLKLVLDELIYIQNKFWLQYDLDNNNYSYQYTIKKRIERGQYLKDSEIKEYYENYIKLYKSIPRTLCHDDLLPFNVLVNTSEACIIDWEVGGILPYPTSLVRLIAHGKKDDDYLFYLSDEDKEFAIKYYYDNFIKYKNIDYDEYIETINYFILYEYCEWIMLREKYGGEELPIHKEYFMKAKNHIQNIKKL